MSRIATAPRAVRSALGVLSAAFAAFALSTLPHLGASGGLLSTWLNPAIVLGVAGVCIWRAVAVEAERAAWALIGAGIAASAGGNICLLSLYAHASTIPSPSVADGFWLLLYPLMYVGLVLLARRHARHRSVGLWLDGLIGALACAALGAAFVLQPFHHALAGQPLAGALVMLAYPVADLMLVAMTAGAMIMIGRQHGPGLRLLAAGTALYAIADCVHLVQAVEGSYAIGGPLDAVWTAGLLLIAFAAAAGPTPVVSKPARPGVRGRLIPVVAGAVALGVLAAQPLTGYDVVASVLAVAALALTLARMSVTLRANSDLLALREREAVTDALTGLSNRRRLVADLAAATAAATAARPLLLVLFDLDGFKPYNDTFGHGAGDALLTRIASRLSAAVAGRGGAYRMGGDEFCVLLDPAGDPPERVAAELSAVMAQHGDGFSVTASHGCAVLPHDGRDASILLRLADDQMYARKAGRRPGAERQVQAALLTALTERDPELGSHAGGVAQLACAVGGELDVPASELRALEHAAALRDIGKLAIPDAIVDKHAPLDPPEQAFMRTHPLIAERIISAAPALGYAARIVRSSQERWDGGGYPDRLRGERIPLLSRIVAVCAAYEELTTGRDASSPTTALAELHREGGTRFDPAVVAALAAAVVAQAGAGYDASTRSAPA